VNLREAIKAIRKAKQVYVWCPITHVDGVEFRTTKSEAILALSLHSPPYDLRVRVSDDGEVVYIAC
jgi:hypothetical protein